MITKKAVLTLNGKFYHAYDANEINDAQTRARKLTDAGNTVNLKWVSEEQASELENGLVSQLEEIKIVENDLNESKEEMIEGAILWGQANPGFVRKVNKLETEVKQMRAKV